MMSIHRSNATLLKRVCIATLLSLPTTVNAEVSSIGNDKAPEVKTWCMTDIVVTRYATNYYPGGNGPDHGIVHREELFRDSNLLCDNKPHNVKKTFNWSIDSWTLNSLDVPITITDITYYRGDFDAQLKNTTQTKREKDGNIADWYSVDYKSESGVGNANLTVNFGHVPWYGASQRLRDVLDFTITPKYSDERKTNTTEFSYKIHRGSRAETVYRYQIEYTTVPSRHRYSVSLAPENHNLSAPVGAQSTLTGRVNIESYGTGIGEVCMTAGINPSIATSGGTWSSTATTPTFKGDLTVTIDTLQKTLDLYKSNMNDPSVLSRLECFRFGGPGTITHGMNYNINVRGYQPFSGIVPINFVIAFP
ncbi:hypothetical protein [Escherichia coli]|uniref:hypothetical protein n=1 Tax=Escherichia coli TaxID=562 RepID=UPI00200C11BE|nr:hypothetical protein [Escherichia coli]MCL0910365.1 hypothetical protein [Escherichia coli]